MDGWRDGWRESLEEGGGKEKGGCGGRGRRGMIKGEDLLPATTGITGGKEYIISVKHVHSKRTIFENSPTGPNQKGPCLILSRPLMSRQTTGME